MGNTKYKSVREIIEKYHEFEVHLPFSDVCQTLDELYEIREKEEKTVWINIFMHKITKELQTYSLPDAEKAKEHSKILTLAFKFIKTIKTSVRI